MLSSLKSKMIVPIVGLMIVMVAFIVVYASVSKTNLINRFEDEQLGAAVNAVSAYLTLLEQQTFIAVMALGGSAELIRRIDNGDRIGVWEYLVDQKTLWGVTSIIVTDTEGRAFARSALRDLYGDDVSGGPSISAGLRRETVTLYMPTPTAPLVMTSAAPIMDGDRLVGVAAVNFDVAINDFVDRISNTFDVDTTVFAGNTSVASTLVHPETGERAVGTAVAPHISAVVLDLGEHLTLNLNVFGLLPFVAYYFPLLGAGGNPVGMFFIGISQEQSIATTLASLRNTILIGGVSLVFIAFVMFFFILRMVKPIAFLTQTLDHAANGDLTKRLPEHGRDEIAKASRSFNKTMEELRKMIIAIKGQTGTLSDIGNDLASNMTETAAAMNEIAANIRSIKGKVINQSASVTQTNSTMEQVSSNINKLSEHVESQSTAVSEASSSIEQMLASIQSVTATLAKNAANVKQLQESAETGKSSLYEVASNIQEIAKESEGLMEINAVMENIASQTNLLSMNAAIEAAHAGDTGKGFSVVADEIRKLAESSGEQSKTIGDVLKKMKESIEKITRSTERVLSRFEVIDQGVKTVAEQEENIRNAMDEQNHGSKQILKSSGQVSNVTQQVKAGSVEMLEGSKEVIVESRNLEKLTYEITDGMNEMAVGAEQVNRAVNTVNDLTGKTKDNISFLVQSVSMFKV